MFAGSKRRRFTYANAKTHEWEKQNQDWTFEEKRLKRSEFAGSWKELTNEEQADFTARLERSRPGFCHGDGIASDEPQEALPLSPWQEERMGVQDAWPLDPLLLDNFLRENAEDADKSVSNKAPPTRVARGVVNRGHRIREAMSQKLVIKADPSRRLEEMEYSWDLFRRLSLVRPEYPGSPCAGLRIIVYGFTHVDGQDAFG